MRKAIGIGGFGAIAIVLMFLTTTAPMVGGSYGYSTHQDLMAGQDEYVGFVDVTLDSTGLLVTYSTVDDWVITEMHVALSAKETCTYSEPPLRSMDPDTADVPAKNGNPTPGKFPYKATFEDGVTEYTFDIPLPDDFKAGYYLCFATHAVVEEIIDGVTVQSQTAWAGDKEFSGKNWATYFCYRPAKLLTLPSAATVTYNSPGNVGTINSYWRMYLSNVGTGYDVTNGYYVGWCADELKQLGNPSTHSATFYPSYASNLPNYAKYKGGSAVNGLIEWDKITYIINKYDSTTQTEKNDDGKWSDGEVQMAIWMFTGDETSCSGDAKKIYDDANANGANFVPEPGGWVAVILYVDDNTQLTFIEVDP